jgi:Family of unknown function (DUF6535)
VVPCVVVQVFYEEFWSAFVVYQHPLESKHHRMKRMADSASNNENKLDNQHTPLQGRMRYDRGTSRNVIQLSLPLLTRTTAQDKIWDMYLDEVKEDDNRISGSWIEDSTNMLTFVSPDLLIPPFISMTIFKIGLMAGTISAFIIEFYKQLTPSTNLTINLLANGTYSITGNQPPPPSVSIIWANALWLISLVLCLASALIATLLQQSARKYVEMSNLPGDPNHRARVRSFLFLGTEIYKMRLIAQLGPTLLQLSVYLFFAGLVIVFRTINKSVAIAVEVSVGILGLAYITLSILPCLDARCPYRTQLSYFLWYPTHAILSFAALCLRWLLELLHGCLVDPGSGDFITLRERILFRWLDWCEEAVKTHWRYIKDGIGKSIINSATDAQGEDPRIVTRLFNLLVMPVGDKSKLREFAASISRNDVLYLIPRIKSGKIVLQEPLRILLRSCTASPNVAGPDEKVRRRSLLICLEAIHNIVKEPTVPNLEYVRANFANIDRMRVLWDDSDTAIRVASRSICALIAKQVIREKWLDAEQLRWLQEVTGSRAVYSANPETKNRMNLKSFVRGVLSDQEGDLPTEDASSFKETLVILMDAGSDAHFDPDIQIQRLSEEVGRIHHDDPEGSVDVVYKLRAMFSFLPEYFPPPQDPPQAQE